ncbi:Aste57867_22832 [Aphanomyces stellatus]|uniref:Translocation protein SEC62 n=1 Tax=Aphanomyces stellatus TaxID=120398 RepID=A0A485LL84_9STRA|nr:hypothetical protein As57867_022761 [Aphanomyces stellatus]VFT99483.1 Aste57867_22832 [Aphanomyces stellatus]
MSTSSTTTMTLVDDVAAEAAVAPVDDILQDEIVLLDLDTTKALADMLLPRTSKREAIERDRRVVYFRGKDLRRCVGEWKTTATYDINTIGQSLLAHGFVHKSIRVKKQQPTHPQTPSYTFLEPTEDQRYSDDGVYTWMYEGSMFWMHMASAAFFVVLGVGVLYPVWPTWAQEMLWHAAVTACLGLSAILSLRFAVWLGVWLATGKHLWVLPQFPRADPVYQLFSYPKRTTAWMHRALVAFVLVAAVVYYIQHPPTCAMTKKGCVGLGRKLIKQAYKGTLMQRFSQEQKDFAFTIFRIFRRLF